MMHLRTHFADRPSLKLLAEISFTIACVCNSFPCETRQFVRSGFLSDITKFACMCKRMRRAPNVLRMLGSRKIVLRVALVGTASTWRTPLVACVSLGIVGSCSLCFYVGEACQFATAASQCERHRFSKAFNHISSSVKLMPLWRLRACSLERAESGWWVCCSLLRRRFCFAGGGSCGLRAEGAAIASRKSCGAGRLARIIRRGFWI